MTSPFNPLYCQSYAANIRIILLKHRNKTADHFLRCFNSFEHTAFFSNKLQIYMTKDMLKSFIKLTYKIT